ncbi:MAG: calcium-binding protein [Myxococcales bacterium]|nr:calcium-binding protein [Myxococcales bacterium]MCB9704109.1 calcium-binding protein [Myxococcales bacterium]
MTFRLARLLSLALLVTFVPACDEGRVSDDDTIETCDAIGLKETCKHGGVRYCDWIDGEVQWGECLESVECKPGDERSCGFSPTPDEPDLTYSCQLLDGVPRWPEDACNTPLVLAFDGAAVEYRSAGPATFPIASEACVDTDWPTAATPWLALDRDRSGAIEGGHELFGTGVIEGGRRASDGFTALAPLDSDGDGVISASDERFGELLVWADEDGDRRSSAWELQPLSAYGVLAIDLGYAIDRRCDARGNCEVQRASFVYADGHGGERRGDVVDVHLSCQ